MAIKLGNQEITLRVGSAECRVYLGSTLVYSGGTPPTPSYKWLATYTGGTTSSAECDSTSAITENEILKTDLQSVEIGSCVTSIGFQAFSNCSALTSVEIGSGVTSIGDEAFVRCASLINITVSPNNTVYDSRNNCNAIIKTSTNELILGCETSVIPNNITSIGSWAFYNCSGLTSVNIPNSVTSIGEYAFAQCDNLESIAIPSGVTSIGDGAFSQCGGLTSIIIPSGVTSISDFVFSECYGLTSVTIPNRVTSIGDGAFDSCESLTAITIPSWVTSISEYAFNNCSSLTTVTIGKRVTSIGGSAFGDCSSLQSITCLAVVPPILDESAFDNTNDCPIYVPSGSLTDYQSEWADYEDRIQAIP